MESKEEIIEKIKNIEWWHTIDLGEYGITKGQTTQFSNDKINLPDDLTGKTVLDIGAVDGCYSFEAERRNAERVLAVDGEAWDAKLYCKTGRQGFDLARKLLNSKVEDLYIEDFNEGFNVETVGQHDVVLCLGVLYHMKDPFRFIRKLKEITKEKLILETQTDANFQYAWNILGTPLMAFYPGKELNGDETNWWGPNIPCLIKMLEVAGFKNVDIKYISKGYRIFIHADA